jgi:hypothetical protein
VHIPHSQLKKNIFQVCVANSHVNIWELLHNPLKDTVRLIDKYANLLPENLDVLSEGVQLAGSVDKKVRLLRRLPKDPFTKSSDWGRRSMQDDPKSNSWGGQNVFDVYTKSTDTALDGTKYSDW